MVRTVSTGGFLIALLGAKCGNLGLLNEPRSARQSHTSGLILAVVKARTEGVFLFCLNVYDYFLLLIYQDEYSREKRIGND
jgi:hypothetical protein